ncbi:hypothetical protein KEM52_004219 [Ascosphaera acerosa]|nr:hypothetical protein KEM52_004219 [Ascosphaera acerosa]
MRFSYRLAQETVRAVFYRRKADADAAPVAPAAPADLPLHMLLLCGSMSGAFTSLLLTPVELVKCKMQVPAAAGAGAGAGARPARIGPLAIVAQVFRREGLLGFWRGQLGTLIRETGGSAAWFGAYEGVSLFFRNRIRRQQEQERRQHDSDGTSIATAPVASPAIQLPVYQQMLAGAAAGICYNFTFYPADTIKSVLQTEEIGAASAAGASSGTTTAKRTFSAVGRALYRERGIRGLYQGCGITCARAAPSSAFIFTVYEALRFYLG